MSDVFLGQEEFRLAIQPGGKPIEITRVPITEGQTGRTKAFTIPSFHLGFGDSDYVTEGKYEYSVNLDGSLPGRLLPGPLVTDYNLGDGEPRDFIEYQGYLFIAAGPYVRRLNPSTGTLTLSKFFAEGNTVMSMEIWNGFLYVALEPSQSFWQLTSIGATDTWTEGPLPAVRLHSAPDRMWLADSDGSTKALVRAVADDPMTEGDWNAPEYVDRQDIPITAIGTIGNVLMVSKEDGMYGVDAETGQMLNVLDEVAVFPDDDNGWATKVFEGAVYYPHVKGLVRYQPGDASHIGLEKLRINRSPVKGHITAIRPVGAELWLAIWTGTDTYLCTLSFITLSTLFGGIEAAIHPKVKLTGVQCFAFHVSNLWSEPRLWFGKGVNLAYVILSDETIDQDSAGYRWALSGSIFSGQIRCAPPGTLVRLDSVEFRAEGCDADHTWQPQVELDEDGVIHKLPIVRTSGRVVVPAPRLDPAEKVNLSFLYAASESSDHAEIQGEITLRYTEDPRTARVFTVQLSLLDGEYFQRINWLLDNWGNVFDLRIPTMDYSGRAQLVDVQPKRPEGDIDLGGAGTVIISLKETV